MSIALEGIGRSEFAGGIGCFPAGESLGTGGESVVKNEFRPAEEVEQSCSSSVGNNSDCSDSDGGDSPEVQSKMKGPLETMDSLEESLPIRRGLSKFYCSKSKSFTSLADAISSISSAKELAKPQNPYTRKRKNLLACIKMWDKIDGNISRPVKGGMPKRPANSNRSTASLTASSSSSMSNGNNSEEEQEPYLLRPPRCPNGKHFASRDDTHPPGAFLCDVRSFSMADLQSIACSTPSYHPP
ncbi:uncharacterized protein LOC120263054 [Dioscorea cayenensis subsp. rotundata]|uniref:Uncharacterized protein LOC120263054 n=1 Tax=Dioscorea cayennensis subsp. rotundata TaxID=55577 RepID=A0AB40BHS5_DIOCR|nr:uncharacterized protein LOC120263054 [Dioscorea cayenensis subsp. rotundata]